MQLGGGSEPRKKSRPWIRRRLAPRARALLPVQILPALAEGMVLSSVTAMRLSPCKGGAVALSVLVVLALSAGVAAGAAIVCKGVARGDARGEPRRRELCARSRGVADRLRLPTVFIVYSAAVYRGVYHDRRESHSESFLLPG